MRSVCGFIYYATAVELGLLRHLARVCASCFLFDSLVFVFMGHATVFYVVEDYVRRFIVYVRCHSGGGAWPIFRLQQVVACVLMYVVATRDDTQR